MPELKFPVVAFSRDIAIPGVIPTKALHNVTKKKATKFTSFHFNALRPDQNDKYFADKIFIFFFKRI